MGIVIVFASGVLGALFSLGYKFNGLRPSPTLMLLALMSAVGTLLSLASMALFGELEIPREALYAGIPQGCASFTAVYVFVLVTRKSRLNVSWTIIQFYVVVPFFVSLFAYHDGFTLRGFAGVAAIFASIILFGRKSDVVSAPTESPARWSVTMLIIATACSGIANTMLKVYTAVDIAAPPFPMMLVSNGTFWVLTVATSILRRVGYQRVSLPAGPRPGQPSASLSLAGSVTRSTIAIAVWMGVMQLSGAALLIVALRELAGTIAYPARIVVNIVGVVFFSRLLFGERLNRSEWVGTLIAVAGVALVASST